MPSRYRRRVSALRLSIPCNTARTSASRFIECLLLESFRWIHLAIRSQSDDWLRANNSRDSSDRVLEGPLEPSLFWPQSSPTAPPTMRKESELRSWKFVEPMEIQSRQLRQSHPHHRQARVLRIAVEISWQNDHLHPCQESRYRSNIPFD